MIFSNDFGDHVIAAANDVPLCSPYGAPWLMSTEEPIYNDGMHAHTRTHTHTHAHIMELKRALYSILLAILFLDSFFSKL